MVKGHHPIRWWKHFSRDSQFVKLKKGILVSSSANVQWFSRRQVTQPCCCQVTLSCCFVLIPPEEFFSLPEVLVQSEGDTRSKVVHIGKWIHPSEFPVNYKNKSFHELWIKDWEVQPFSEHEKLKRACLHKFTHRSCCVKDTAKPDEEQSCSKLLLLNISNKPTHNEDLRLSGLENLECTDRKSIFDQGSS